MTYLTVAQFEPRHRLVRAELERERASAERPRVVERRSRRLLRAVRGATA